MDLIIKDLDYDFRKSWSDASSKITRKEATAKHKDLPPGGTWRTIRGHHIYIKNGKVLAGAFGGKTGAKKATKKHIALYQEHVDKEAKKAKTKAKATKKTPGKKPAPKASKPEPEEHYELYHGTKLPSVESILKDGFRPKGDTRDFGRAVYFKSPSLDKLDHADHEAMIKDREARGFKIHESARTPEEDALGVVRGFRSIKAPAVIKASIAKKHVLDCTGGRPRDLEDMIKGWFGKVSLNHSNRTRLGLNFTFGANIPESASFEDIKQAYDAHRPQIDAMFGTGTQLGALSPYEIYAKKKGVGAIVDKLNNFSDEGWQIGVYDPKLIKILDHGKDLEREGDTYKLIKALLKSLAKSDAPYCLLGHEFDSEGNLILHVGAMDNREDAVEKSLDGFYSFVKGWKMQ